MPRALRSPLENRSNRLKLPNGKREWLKLGEGLSLIYRRDRGGIGTWSVQTTDAGGVRRLQKIGLADDYEDANGAKVLTFAQAQAEARKLSQSNAVGSALTVAAAVDHYLKWFRANRKSVRDTELALNAHVLPRWGTVRVSALKPRALRSWHEELATAPPRRRTKPGSTQNFGEAGDRRPRQATANRILTILKAALNKAYEDGLVSDRSAWEVVRPFRGVDEPVIRFLEPGECTRLLEACTEEFRRLVHGALLTGARYGELTSLKIGDVNLDRGSIFIRESKGGKPRHVPLNSAGRELFGRLTAGGLRDEYVFLRADGKPWGRSHQARPLNAACEKAGIEPAVSFHELRHTYASALAQAGVDLLTISKLLGHADTRITSRHYAHLCDRTLAAAVETRLPDF